MDASTIGSQATGLSAGTFWSAGHASSTSSQNHFDTTCEVNAHSADVYDKVQADGFDCGLCRSGNLILTRNEEERTHVSKVHEHLLDLGYNVLMLCNHDAVCQVEPALREGNAVAALWTLESGYVSPLLACRSILEAAEAQSHSSQCELKIYEGERATIYPDNRSKGVKRCESGERIEVQTSQGNVFCAHHVVVAAGVSSPSLLLPVGLKVPIYPVQGTMMHFGNLNDGMQENSISHTIYLTEAEIFWQNMYKNKPEAIRKADSYPRYCTHDPLRRQITRHCYGRPTLEGDMLFGGTRIPLTIKDNKWYAAQVWGKLLNLINSYLSYFHNFMHISSPHRKI